MKCDSDLDLSLTRFTFLRTRTRVTTINDSELDLDSVIWTRTWDSDSMFVTMTPLKMFIIILLNIKQRKELPRIKEEIRG